MSRYIDYSSDCDSDYSSDSDCFKRTKKICPKKHDDDWDRKKKKCCKKPDIKCVKEDKLTLQRTFHTKLTPEQEVVGCGNPTPDVKTTGKFWICFDKGLTGALYKLAVFCGKKITQAHLHYGRANENGPIVAFLFNVAPLEGPGGVSTCGVIAKDTLTNDDIVCNSHPVVNIASLFDAIRRGDIYVNVHFEEFPAGVIRGQIFAANTTA